MQRYLTLCLYTRKCRKFLPSFLKDSKGTRLNAPLVLPGYTIFDESIPMNEQFTIAPLLIEETKGTFTSYYIRQARAINVPATLLPNGKMGWQCALVPAMKYLRWTKDIRDGATPRVRWARLKKTSRTLTAVGHCLPNFGTFRRGVLRTQRKGEQMGAPKSPNP